MGWAVWEGERGMRRMGAWGGLIIRWEGGGEGDGESRSEGKDAPRRGK